MNTMMESTPIVGSVSAGLLAQTVAGPWWLPLLIQIISLGVGYLQGRKAEVKKTAALVRAVAADAPAEMHGGLPMTEVDDQP